MRPSQSARCSTRRASCNPVPVGRSSRRGKRPRRNVRCSSRSPWRNRRRAASNGRSQRARSWHRHRSRLRALASPDRRLAGRRRTRAARRLRARSSRWRSARRARGTTAERACVEPHGKAEGALEGEGLEHERLAPADQEALRAHEDVAKGADADASARPEFDVEGGAALDGRIDAGNADGRAEVAKRRAGGEPPGARDLVRR